MDVSFVDPEEEPLGDAAGLDLRFRSALHAAWKSEVGDRLPRLDAGGRWFHWGSEKQSCQLGLE